MSCVADAVGSQTGQRVLQRRLRIQDLTVGECRNEELRAKHLPRGNGVNVCQRVNPAIQSASQWLFYVNMPRQCQSVMYNFSNTCSQISVIQYQSVSFVNV
jgi:hypothetical protein